MAEPALFIWENVCCAVMPLARASQSRSKALRASERMSASSTLRVIFAVSGFAIVQTTARAFEFVVVEGRPASPPPP